MRPATDDPAPGTPAGERRVLVRISETFGLPAPLPDWAGLAIRIDPEPGEDAPPDLLLVSGGTPERVWRGFAPTREVLACGFTSKVRYGLGGVDQVVLATPVRPRPGSLGDLLGTADPGPLAYRLRAGMTPDDLRDLGELVLDAPAPPDDHAARFRPPPAGGDAVGEVRRRVYRWFQGDRPGSPAR